MTVRSELEQLFDSDDILRVETAHDWAESHPSSALYRALEWDDVIAAREHRYSQIRRLISIHIVDEDRRRQTISLSIDRVASNSGYRRVDDVMEVVGLREVALRDALAEYQRIKDKYDWLKELDRIHREIEAAAARRRPPRRRRPRDGDGDGDRPTA
jgi:hypothetical protein